MLEVKKGDVIEICHQKYGDIKAYIVDDVKSTSRDSVNDARFRNSNYLILRPISDDDTITETTDRYGNIIWALKKKSSGETD